MNKHLMDIGEYLVKRHDNFVPFVFSLLKNSEYIETRFDYIINSALDKTLTGKIKRLIINIPPRHGKTLKAVHAYVARGYAINPKSNFIHTSYSDKLVHDNSVTIRDIINHPDYQKIFPHVTFKQDSNAKGLWRTTAGGTFLASPAGGSITGFGAGIIGATEFSGALIIDDPVKPDDAGSDALISSINQRWENTLKSRLADQNTPVIVIMQRIAENDFTAELLDRSGADEDWHHLVLPAYISADYIYTQAGRYIEHNLSEGALFSEKFTDAQAKNAMTNIQWSQEPSPARGEIYEREWFRRYTSLPNNIKSLSIYCDTASKTKKYNDYSVFQLWAKTTSNQGYLIMQERDKIKVPFLKDRFIKFYNESKKYGNIVNIGIEDKDSGVGLIQALELERYKVKAIQRNEGKYARAVKATPNILHGNIFLPVGAVGDAIISEAVKFKADDSHAHDDQIDPMNDFINYELPKFGYSLENIL